MRSAALGMRAIQQTIDEAGIEVGNFPGMGRLPLVLVRCGLDSFADAGSGRAKRRLYGGVPCKNDCGFSDGAESYRRTRQLSISRTTARSRIIPPTY